VAAAAQTSWKARDVVTTSTSGFLTRQGHGRHA
jgi:hypothetical protein